MSGELNVCVNDAIDLCSGTSLVLGRIRGMNIFYTLDRKGLASESYPLI